ncbi:response regulator [Rhodonellum sp.]|uniref:response regulator n=1 Tax=Rhodonellum sp. TaxID=2231180 RepID=UPI002717F4CC|nr:response regulator [Rhodonellum sp.]MDO9550895.1 response regulator [Rhodonellum sp.]
MTKNKKVLIVDDNALNRKVFEHIIGQVYFYETAENGVEAIEKVKEGDFDLILMDIQMPLLDGISALKIIKAEQLTNSPVIAISAYASTADRDYFLSAGFDDFIAKPITPRQLLETIENNILKNGFTFEDSQGFDEDLILDETVINQLMKYNTLENIKTVYQDFLDESFRLLTEINLLIKEENYPEIGEKIHIMKGNSGTLGAMKIFNFTKAFEKNIKTTNFDNIFREYLILEGLITSFQEHLQAKKMI